VAPYKSGRLLAAITLGAGLCASSPAGPCTAFSLPGFAACLGAGALPVLRPRGLGMGARDFDPSPSRGLCAPPNGGSILRPSLLPLRLRGHCAASGSAALSACGLGAVGAAARLSPLSDLCRLQHPGHSAARRLTGLVSCGSTFSSVSPTALWALGHARWGSPAGSSPLGRRAAGRASGVCLGSLAPSGPTEFRAMGSVRIPPLRPVALGAGLIFWPHAPPPGPFARAICQYHVQLFHISAPPLLRALCFAELGRGLGAGLHVPASLSPRLTFAHFVAVAVQHGLPPRCLPWTGMGPAVGAAPPRRLGTLAGRRASLWWLFHLGAPWSGGPQPVAWRWWAALLRPTRSRPVRTWPGQVRSATAPVCTARVVAVLLPWARQSPRHRDTVRIVAICMLAGALFLLCGMTSRAPSFYRSVCPAVVSGVALTLPASVVPHTVRPAPMSLLCTAAARLLVAGVISTALRLRSLWLATEPVLVAHAAGARGGGSLLSPSGRLFASLGPASLLWDGAGVLPLPAVVELKAPSGRPPPPGILPVLCWRPVRRALAATLSHSVPVARSPGALCSAPD